MYIYICMCICIRWQVLSSSMAHHAKRLALMFTPVSVHDAHVHMSWNSCSQERVLMIIRGS